ncbi:unnamed protein product [Heterobilharzia americana]|nr:unnamed protein product [Heterobilharzia americana]
MTAHFSSHVFMDTCNHYTHRDLRRVKTAEYMEKKDQIDMEMKIQPYDMETDRCSSTVNDKLTLQINSKPWDSTDARIDPYPCDLDLELCNQSNYLDVYGPNRCLDYKKVLCSTSREYKQFLAPPPPPQECTQRRTSLHGKTITIRISRNETRYRKLQAKIYNFLERPKTWPSVIYHVIVFASVFGCLVLSVLSTIHEYTESAGRILLYMELVILFWFFAEYCLRLWSAGCRSRYQTWRGRLNFARRPFCIVDVIVIVASVIVLAVDSDRNMFAASALRGLRFFQILRMIRMDRRGGSFKLLASVVWAHRQELFTTVYIGFLGLIFSSFLIFLVEKKENEKIRTYADALWWGVITLCTVGYGDSVPQSGLGKTIAGCSCLAIISFYALPPGILGSGFALKVQQHQRQKHLIRRRVPAATLIQCLWRCYAADPHSSSSATWKIHMRPLRKPVGLTNSYSMIERSGFSRFSRFSTLKRRSEKIPSGTNINVNNTAPSLSSDEPNAGTPRSAPAKHECSDVIYNFVHNEEAEKMKHIQEALDSEKIQDSLEKGADELLTAYSKAQITNDTKNATDLLPSGPSEYVNISKRRGQLTSYGHSYPYHTTFQQDSVLCSSRGSEVILHPLTEKEKVAVRVIRKLRFLVARRKFREALRPYDVKDVIEQYSAGHVDMLARVKTLQARLDQILGRPGSKSDDVYDSHQCLASRIVKIEHKIDTVEMKLDRLITLYKADRLLKYHNHLETSDPIEKHSARSREKSVQEKYVQYYNPSRASNKHEGSDTMISTEEQQSQPLGNDRYVINNRPYIRFTKRRLPTSERSSLVVNSSLALANETWRSFDSETPVMSASFQDKPKDEVNETSHSRHDHNMHLKSQFLSNADELPSKLKHIYALQSASSGNIVPGRGTLSTSSESCLKTVEGNDNLPRSKPRKNTKPEHDGKVNRQKLSNDPEVLLHTCNFTESIDLIKMLDPHPSPSRPSIGRQEEIPSTADHRFLDDDKNCLLGSNDIISESVKNVQDNEDE